MTHRYHVASDTTAPTITLVTPGPGAVFGKDQVVTVDFRCADEAGGSGLESCDGTDDNGAQLDTSKVGTHTFAVTASDKAGNTQSVSHAYTVVKAVSTTLAAGGTADHRSDRRRPDGRRSGARRR